jgi:glycosyltransferase involved in cell wall biosynthesis
MLNISVVIPLYNKADYIRQTLISLHNQQKKPDEIILVDDASTDEGLQIAQQTFNEYAQGFEKTNIIIVELKENSGPGHARNTGLQKATGDIVSFLDADDTYHPQLLYKVNKYMSTEKIQFLVVGIQLFPSNIHYPDVRALHPYLDELNEELYRLPNPLWAASSPHFIMGLGSNVFVQRCWIGEHSYERGALLNEGVDFWYRILKNVTTENKNKVGLLNGNYIRVTEVPNSLSRKKYTHWKELEIPPSVVRFKKSRDIFDQQLASMICLRWYQHAMGNFPTLRQKLAFIGHRRVFLLKGFWWRLKRNFIKYRSA